ncbi:MULTISPECIES: superoxide dismutase family protein [Streptosporangium]|uniref:Cu-Zn family superoxide dismutase n=1 Tax=Streptosporangium brasiliense TaxID=47480 RepID=A0ABT9RBP5_9ACTN|nr:superoxide dismutase family protein [Streptosporangium brasiliense]MDP9865810.1 Cu-Zn family superoxide dismutase [Streptosporangium brasiliense]
MRILVALAAVGLLSVACAGQEAVPQPHPAGHVPSATGIRLSGGGTLTVPVPKASAIAYDIKLAPPGASARVMSESGAVLATSTLTVGGLLPNRTYGAHLHVNPCGASPEDAGPHYQHAHSHASADNEVWLDFTTDAEGGATATAKQDWAFASDRLPGSLVIHAQRTRRKGAEAGTAGPRVACVTLTKR